MTQRRAFLKGMAGIPVMAALSGSFLKNLSETGRSSKPDNTDFRINEYLSDLEGNLPVGKLGDLKITRMIMGCNQMSGYAHARDLKYANKLFKAYNTDQKILETLHLGEKAGVNTTFMTNSNYPVFHEYLNEQDGKMQSICQTYLKPEDFLGDIDRAVGNGANALYIQGGEADRYVRDGKIAMLFKAIEHIKKQGHLAGIGAHSLEVIKACENEGLPSDFYVKTFHNDDYWSAHPESERVEFSVDIQRNKDHNKINDNMFDLFPLRTKEYMKGIKKPWIAFKVLAGGAILPEDGFRFAFENGADFICVGMFDFQVVENINTANKILADLKKREREWFS